MANPLSVPNAKLAVKVPRFVYGTAWKKDQTAALVSQAIRSGFRGIDTAAQPKHYEEDLVGDGIREALRAGVCRREDLHVRIPTPHPPKLLISLLDPNQIHSTLRPGPFKPSIRPFR